MYLNNPLVIDPYPYSDKDLREAEETILYYLSKSTQYLITEEQVVAQCRVSLFVKYANRLDHHFILKILRHYHRHPNTF